jgi:BCD family chlorophyll transporter-like MFS transporter
MLAGFVWAARRLAAGADPHRLAGFGVVGGIAAFLCVMFAGPLEAPGLLGVGAFCIGAGAGLFSVGTLTAAMAISHGGGAGLALGAWGAVQATATGIAVVIGAFMRDLVSAAAVDQRWGPVLAVPTTGYVVVYLVEVALLLATLVALGPLVRGHAAPSTRFGLSELPI